MYIKIINLMSKFLKRNLVSILGMAALFSIHFSVSAQETCYTSCVGAIQLECGTNRLFGVCVGAWGCGDQRGAHMCLKDAGGDPGNSSTCKNDNECPSGFRCATWAAKKNECVKTCERDSDCPLNQQCKKPLGTSFKRCK